MSDSRLEGEVLEVLRAGATGAGGSGAILDGVVLEVMRRLSPGEAQITQFRASILATDFPGPARVTTEDVSFSGTDDPASVRVTHESVSIGTTDAPGKARVTHLYVQVLTDNIPIPPPLPQLQSCDLMLEVFNDDRETVRWSCSTRLDVSNPFLMMPERYAEQELDVAEGSATLGTVTVMVVDVPQETGDQNTGFMTGRLASQAAADLQGRRARLLRAIGTGDDQLLEVVIDGVAGTPRMDSSYAAFGFEIRDTREIERKIRAFVGANEVTTAMLPHGVITSYGLNPETGLYLLDAVGTLSGMFIQHNSTYPNPATGSIDLTISNPADQRTIPLSIHALLEGTVAERGGPHFGNAYAWYRTRFPNLSLWWKPTGFGGPWTVIDGAHLILDGTASHPRTNLATVTNDVPGEEVVEIEWLTFGDDRVAPAGLDVPAYSPYKDGASLPAHLTPIELMIVSSGGASELSPVHIEGLTAGQFAKNMYDGLYSPRDQDGNVVPTGILYDEAALLAMDDPVRIRITEPIKDGRDWLEKHIYAPTGWVPALDIFGRISPVSQEAPDDIFSLPLIYDEITEPAPEWNSGEHIVNVVKFTYKRDYLPEDVENAETGDGLSDRDIIMEFRDEGSITRNGEQLLELAGDAFRAIGTPKTGEPALEDGQAAELGYALAFERRDHVLNRYALGAPTMTVNVRRDATPTLRAGSWVRVWLSWFPDYVTGERGLIALCQIVAIGDMDCVWRKVTMEQVIPLSLYDVDENVRFSLLVGKTSKFLTGKSGLPLTAIV